MPKVVDHGERRRELAEAVWRVILRDGVEGVSVRNVAADAGWSTGALRHYFATKEDLLAAAGRLLEERVIGRFESGRHNSESTLRERVREVLCEVLPLDGERREEGALWFAFAARSLVDPKVAQEHALVFDGVRELCYRIVFSLDENGWLISELSPEVEAARLHALVDGLAVHGLMGRLDEGELLRILDAHLDQIVRDS